MVSIAVLGTGSIGSRHLSVLKKMSGVKPVAVPLRLSRRTELKKQGFAIASDLEDAYKLGCSLAIIATDTRRHVQDAKQAMACGFTVLMEKPLARDAREARSIAQIAKKKRLPLYVGCCLRFNDSLRTFKKQLHRIGMVHSVRIDYSSYLPDWRPHRDYRTSYSANRNEGGVLRDLIHEIDYAGWIFGWPARVLASLRNTGHLKINSEEAADLHWTHRANEVSIHLDYLTRPSRRGMIAVGEHGTLMWNALEQKVTLSLHGKSAQTLECKEDYNAMYERQAHAFIQASRKKTSDLATAAEGIKALAICDAARISSKNHREVKINYGV